jgi:hypothetical protein
MSILKGYKTYILLGCGAIIVILHKLGVPLPPGIVVDDDAFLTNLWTLVTTAALRHGMN